MQSKIIISTINHAVIITMFVFVMMMLVDYLNVISKGSANKLINGGKLRQYSLASLMGSLPGCLGSFMNVSFYIHGMISLGAIAGGMIATSGDEAFVMLAMFPGKAIMLFIGLFFVGIISGYIIDYLVKVFKIKTCKSCESTLIHESDDCRCLDFKEIFPHLKKPSFSRVILIIVFLLMLYLLISGQLGPKAWNWNRITMIFLIFIAQFIVITVPDHFLEEHIWVHIVKKHIFKVFLWTVSMLLLINMTTSLWDVESFLKGKELVLLVIAALIGLIPESGPHLLFVALYAKGIIPLSVLVTSSIVQDGHGMLPMFSYSVKDSLLIKVFNLFIGILVGILVYLFM